MNRIMNIRISFTIVYTVKYLGVLDSFSSSAVVFVLVFVITAICNTFVSLLHISSSSAMDARLLELEERGSS